MNPRQLLMSVFGIFTALMLIITAFSSYHIVPPGHRGVVVTQGSVSTEFLTEGFHWKKPFVSEVNDISIRQNTATGKAECFSADLQNITIEYSVLYRVPEGKVVTVFRDYSGDPFNDQVTPKLYESLKQVTALHRAEELVKSRDAVKMAVLDNLKKAVGDLVFIQDITINNLKLSPDLEKAIETKTVREQEAFAKEFELQKAKKDAEITIVTANADAQAIKIKGDAIKQSPQVIGLTIAQKWNGVSPTTVVGAHGGTSVILPLDKQ